MRRSMLLGSAAGLMLATAACVSSGPGGNVTGPPIRLAPPALQAEPTVKLSGTVYVAQEVGLDPATQAPPGYGPLLSGGSVAVWLASCVEPCARRLESPIAAGAYAISGLPPDTALVVEAGGPGVSRRRVTTYLRSDTLLDFAADPGRSTGPYLVDSPEVVAVEPPPGTMLANGATQRFRITYSEPIDPDSLEPGAFRLTSADVRDLAVAGGSKYLARTATVRLDGPATAVFEIPGPIATVARPAGAAVGLSVGMGTVREVPAGRVVANDSGPKAVSGLAWAPGTAAIAYRLAGDSTSPELVAAIVEGLSADGARLRMRWSEPMAAMLGGGEPQGRIGAGLLDPGAYRFRAVSAGAGAGAAAGPGKAVDTGAATDAGKAVDMVLRELALDPANPAVVTALATGSVPLGVLEIVPVDVADPAGNPATGSAAIAIE